MSKGKWIFENSKCRKNANDFMLISVRQKIKSLAQKRSCTFSVVWVMFLFLMFLCTRGVSQKKMWYHVQATHRKYKNRNRIFRNRSYRGNFLENFVLKHSLINQKYKRKEDNSNQPISLRQNCGHTHIPIHSYTRMSKIKVTTCFIVFFFCA